MTRFAQFATIAAACFCASAPAAIAVQDQEQPAQPGASAVEAFRDAIAPLIGSWEAKAEENGVPSTGRITFWWDPTEIVVLGHTQVRQANGPWEDRELSLFAAGEKPDEISVQTFNDDGSVTDGATLIGTTENGNPLFSTFWDTQGMKIRRDIEIVGESVAIMRLLSRSFDDSPWTTMNETRWERVEDTPGEVAPDQPTEPITAEAFRDAIGPFVGTWEIDAVWAWGETLEARNVYAWDLSEGLVVAHTQAKDGDGPWYNRYLTVFAPGDAPDKIATHTFTYDGTSRVGSMTVGTSEDGNLMLSTSWTMPGSELRQENELTDENTMAWRVWMRPDDESPWAQVMNDEWERVMEPEPTMAAPDAASESDKTIVRTATVDATPAEVWRAWTTSEGMTEWWVEEADIELKIGGKYELYMLPDEPQFAGNRGSERCTILAYAPERMLSTTWNAPPTYAEHRFEHTRITLLLEPVADGSKTTVTLIHSGWPASGWTERGSTWPQVFQYFEGAWTFVFDRMLLHFED